MANPLDAFRDDALAGHVALIAGGGTGICRGIAPAAVFLRSAAGAYVSGHTLVVDGGQRISSPRPGMMS